MNGLRPFPKMLAIVTLGGSAACAEWPTGLSTGEQQLLSQVRQTSSVSQCAFVGWESNVLLVCDVFNEHASGDVVSPSKGFLFYQIDGVVARGRIPQSDFRRSIEGGTMVLQTNTDKANNPDFQRGGGAGGEITLRFDRVGDLQTIGSRKVGELIPGSYLCIEATVIKRADAEVSGTALGHLLEKQAGGMQRLNLREIAVSDENAFCDLFL